MACEVEIKLPEDCKKEDKPKDTRLDSFSMSTKHLPDSKGWEAGTQHSVTLDVLFTGLRSSYHDDGEMEAEMLILPKKTQEKK